jgi:hypothetical protein
MAGSGFRLLRSCGQPCVWQKYGTEGDSLAPAAVPPPGRRRQERIKKQIVRKFMMKILVEG